MNFWDAWIPTLAIGIPKRNAQTPLAFMKMSVVYAGEAVASLMVIVTAKGDSPQEGYDCDGMCLNDEDGDGVCDEFEMAGCMDSEACDYDEVATDSAECDYSCLVSMSLELVGVLDFTTPVGGTSGKAIHLLANADIEDLSVFGIGIANNGGGTDGQEFTFPSLSVADGESLLLVRNQDALEAYFDSCWTEFTYIIQASTSVDQNGDDAIELYEYGEVIETFGDPAVDGTGQDWEYTDSWAYKWNGSWIFGGVNCTDGTQTIYESTCAYPLCSSGIGCTNSEACNYMPSSATDDGSCYFANEGYNCDGLCLEDGDGDGVCDTFEIAGCMDSAACNYNPLATDDDSTCQAFDECGVCGGLGILEGVCDCEGNAPSLGYGCNGECLSDENANGICDFLELEELHSQIEEGIFCGEGTIWVEEWNMCIALPTCFGDLDSDGNRGTEDLLLFLAVYNTQCPLDFGCMDSAAINYNPTADYDDGSCEYGVSEFTCGGPVNYHGYDYSTVLIGVSAGLQRICGLIFIKTVTRLHSWNLRVIGYRQMRELGAFTTTIPFISRHMVNFTIGTLWMTLVPSAHRDGTCHCTLNGKN